jgi:choline dehydrogenase
VTAPRFTNVLSEVFLEACDQAGFPRSPDTNGRQHEGFGVVDQSIHRGRRMSAARAYLHPHAARQNLIVRTGCLATRLVFEGRRSAAVQYRQAGRAFEARAEREVIVSAGAIDSPRLLMLSGIGDAEELRRLGIEVRAHLPAVGAHLQDHLDLQIQQVCREPVTTTPALRLHRKTLIGLRWLLFKDGLGATNHFEAGGNIKTDPSLAQPDNAVWFVPLLVNYDGSPVGHAHGYQVTVMQLQPRCRGRIRLRSTDPRDPPLIATRFLEDPCDLTELREGARCARGILHERAFDRYRGAELLPGDSVRSDAELDDYIRRTVKSTRHPSCTCRMGTDEKTSVVDAAGSVHGVEGLRIVDASVMPSIPRAPINAATIMVAEKLAAAIGDEPPLAPLAAEAEAALAAS